MLEKITDYYLTDPRRITSVGKYLSTLGMTIIMTGLLGNVATSTSNIIGSLDSKVA